MEELGDQSLGLGYAQTEAKIENWQERETSLLDLWAILELSDVMVMFCLTRTSLVAQR